ncbi:MAG: hypothetical protein WCV72_04080 [Patescibacteria group bacterium]
MPKPNRPKEIIPEHQRLLMKDQALVEKIYAWLRRQSWRQKITRLMEVFLRESSTKANRNSDYPTDIFDDDPRCGN